MPHVALIANTGWSMSRHRAEQIRGLAARGWRISAIADYRRGEDREVRSLGADAFHVTCEGASLHPAKNAHYLGDLIRLLRKLRPELVHLFSNKAIVIGGGAAQLAGIKAVVATVTGQGILGAEAGRSTKMLIRALFRFGLPKTAIVIFQNRADLDTFVQAKLVPPERAVLIPGCGVDVVRLAAAPVARAAPRVFIHASRMLWAKGVGEFVAAAEYVRERRPDAQFWLFGGSAEDYPSQNPDFIPRSWLSRARESVLWLGRVDPATIEEALLGSDTAAGVLLSRYAEGVPRFLIEAAACGLPVITTDHPGCRDVVLPGLTGWLCPPLPGSYEAAARAMLLLLDEPQLVDRMGAAARAHVIRFDAGRVLGDTLAVYERVIVGG